MADSRDFLDQTRSLTEKRFGREPTEDDLVAQFMLHGKDQRIWILHGWDGEPQNEIACEETEMRRAADRSALRQRLGAVHEMALKAGR